MATHPQPVEALEQQADRERERLARGVAGIRHDLRERLDVRRQAEDRIRERPGAVYGIAAGCAVFAGYLFGRILKA